MSFSRKFSGHEFDYIACILEGLVLVKNATVRIKIQFMNCNIARIHIKMPFHASVSMPRLLSYFVGIINVCRLGWLIKFIFYVGVPIKFHDISPDFSIA